MWRILVFLLVFSPGAFANPAIEVLKAGFEEALNKVKVLQADIQQKQADLEATMQTVERLKLRLENLEATMQTVEELKLRLDDVETFDKKVKKLTDTVRVSEDEKKLTLSMDGNGILEVSRTASTRPDLNEILEVSRTASTHPDFREKGIYERRLKLLGPNDDTQEVGKTSLYGNLVLHGDNAHASYGMGPILSFFPPSPEFNNGRKFYMAFGDTYNNPSISKDDFIFFSWGKGGKDHIQHIILKANGNIGIGTTNPGAKLDVAGNLIRKIAYTTGNGPSDGTDVGQIKSRVLRFTKAKTHTKIRISYTDNLRTYGSAKGCRWEIRVDGSSCPNQALIYDDYAAPRGDNAHTNTYTSRTVVGYCSGVAVGSHTIGIWVGNVPGYTGSDCDTGWKNSTWVIEAEEVN